MYSGDEKGFCSSKFVVFVVVVDETWKNFHSTILKIEKNSFKECQKHFHDVGVWLDGES